MELIDSHCHLTFDELLENLDDVLERSRTQGIGTWVTVGTNRAQSQAAVTLAQRVDGMYATVGLHPHDARMLSPDLLTQMAQWAQLEKVVALGEMGLDFYYDFSPRDQQVKAFTEQLALAASLKMPVVVHTRDAFDDTLAVLKEFDGQLDHVVLHCFTGTAQQAREGLDRGYFISFSGVVTFKSAQSVKEAALCVPMDRLLIETDCPYLSPAPMRKQRVNEPALLTHTAQYLAQLKRLDLEDLAMQTSQNTRQFYQLCTPI
ncbi:MAG: TatD family hydrolase [Planctomycetes bacterium]|nr:TatD family hydrolase [Planctomycetota bacterium]